MSGGLLSEGSGRSPENLQGTSPLTRYRALPGPVLAGRQEKGAVAPFLLKQDDPGTFCQGTFAAYPRRFHRLRYSTVPLTTVPLPLCGCLVLQIQNRLLAQIDQELPLAGHIFAVLDDGIFYRWFVMIGFMRAEEVIIRDPKSQVLARSVITVEAVCRTIGSFIGAVQVLDQLLVGTVFL